MKKIILLFGFILFFQQALYSQGFTTLVGRVTDEDDKSIVEATVYLEGQTKQIAITDSNGYFMIKNVIPGEYTIKAKTSGFDTHKGVLIISNKEITTINIVMKKDSEYLMDFAFKAMEVIILLIK